MVNTLDSHPGDPCSKPLGGFKVDSASHLPFFSTQLCHRLFFRNFLEISTGLFVITALDGCFSIFIINEDIRPKMYFFHLGK